MSYKIVPCDCCGLEYSQMMSLKGEPTNSHGGNVLKWQRCNLCRRKCGFRKNGLRHNETQ